MFLCQCPIWECNLREARTGGREGVNANIKWHMTEPARASQRSTAAHSVTWDTDKMLFEASVSTGDKKAHILWVCFPCTLDCPNVGFFPCTSELWGSAPPITARDQLFLGSRQSPCARAVVVPTMAGAVGTLPPPGPAVPGVPGKIAGVRGNDGPTTGQPQHCRTVGTT